MRVNAAERTKYSQIQWETMVLSPVWPACQLKILMPKMVWTSDG